MEIRKIQLTGGSSYVLTLPKEWITSHQLKKNDPVGLMTQADGTLLVTPRTTTEQIRMLRRIDVDDSTGSDNLFRMLVGTYIIGFNSVEVCSKGVFPGEAKDAVVRFTQTAIGPEIVEDVGNCILIKDLLNPIEMPFNKTVKRMHMLARNMHSDSVNAALQGDVVTAMSVIERDRELDRLQWLVARQSNLVLKEVIIAKKMEVVPGDASAYSQMSRIIERIGDHAVRIAENASQMEKMKIDADISDGLSKTSKKALELFDAGLDSWFERDICLANGNVNSVPEVIGMCDKLAEMTMCVKGKQAIYISYIIESIRRTAEYSGDISELVINSAMNG